MSFLRKVWADKYIWLLIFLLSVGAFLRLYNFHARLIFGPEQGISFLTSAANLTKFSLLGETNLQRATSDHHIPFHGAYYSYLLLPFLVGFKFQVLPTSLVFVFLNLLTALVFLVVTVKLFGKEIGALSLFFFLFSSVMIHHSLFAWILNPLPLLGVLTLWSVSRLWRAKQRLLPVLWLGIMSGFGFGLQNLYLPFGVFLFILILVISQRRFWASLVFALGAVIGNLPMVIFDLRHDFYHVRTMWQYFWDVYHHQVSGFTDYYHFLYLFPYLFIFYAIISLICYRLSRPLVLIPLSLFLYFNLSSPMFNLRSATGMPPGITLASLEKAAGIINRDHPPTKFNVATLWDFDTRAHPLRYLLTYYYGKTPMPVEEYANIDALYVFAPSDYDIVHPRVWELQTYLPYSVTDLKVGHSDYRLYKLTK